MSNDEPFKLVAWIQKGKTVIYGLNSSNNRKPKFCRRYRDGKCDHSAHAEMSAIDKAGDCRGLDLYVMRLTKKGIPTMSKPCRFCMEHIKRAGIRRVYFTNWDGEWDKINVREK